MSNALPTSSANDDGMQKHDIKNTDAATAQKLYEETEAKSAAPNVSITTELPVPQATQQEEVKVSVEQNFSDFGNFEQP